MQISEKDWLYETERLEKVYIIIQANIEIIDKYLKNIKGDLISTNKLMWENTAHFSDDFDRLVETKQFLDELKHHSDKQKFFIKKKTQMEKLQNSPYFARVDFIEKGEKEAEKVYIGISTLFTKTIYLFMIGEHLFAAFFMNMKLEVPVINVQMG